MAHVLELSLSPASDRLDVEFVLAPGRTPLGWSFVTLTADGREANRRPLASSRPTGDGSWLVTLPGIDPTETGLALVDPDGSAAQKLSLVDTADDPSAVPLVPGDTVRAAIGATRYRLFRPELGMGFAAGTLILTPWGETPVERLYPGDPVLTYDHGAQPVIWSRAARCDAAAMRAMQPVALRRSEGADAALHLPAAHRVLVGPGGVATSVFMRPALAPAGALVSRTECAETCPTNDTVWIQIALPHHGLIRAGGVIVESALLGPRMLATPPAPDRADLRSIFGVCEDARGIVRSRSGALNGAPARPLLPAGMVRRRLLAPSRKAA